MGRREREAARERTGDGEEDKIRDRGKHIAEGGMEMRQLMGKE